MIILKSQEFHGIVGSAQDLATFVNKNNIKREDILAVTEACSMDAKLIYTIFYYGDSEAKEITKGFLGW